MEPRRFTAKTVDEATDIALEALGANREDVEIVVVKPGRSGILGFGGEPAEIEVRLLEAETPAPAPPPEEPRPAQRRDEPPPAPESEESETRAERDDEPEEEASPPQAAQARTPAAEAVGAEPPGDGEHIADYDDVGEAGPRPGAPPEEPDQEVVDLAAEIIDYFLSSMGVVADTYVREETVDGVPFFDIEGEDAGLLIGRRGETLQAFQYLVNTVLNSQLARSAYVQIDVEGYKERRRETLTGVARRAAARAADNGESVELEPMPAYERRWIHLALADSQDVRTESKGREGSRYVVIYPNSSPNRRRGRGGRRRRGRGGNGSGNGASE